MGNTHGKEILEHFDTLIFLKKACTSNLVDEAQVSLLHELLEVEPGGRGHGGAVADAETSQCVAHRLCVCALLRELYLDSKFKMLILNLYRRNF